MHDVLLVAGAMWACVICGWWLHAACTRERSPARWDHERLASLHQLQQLAGRVASDVGGHRERMREISQQLAATRHPTAEVVLTALARLMENSEQMQRQLDSAEQRLRHQAQQIEWHETEARTDSLTQLLNRRGLDDELTRGVAEFQTTGRPFCLMLIDVDNFKQVNDVHGHRVGDAALQAVANALREVTAIHSAIPARFGGEEFAVVFPGLSAAAAVGIAEQIRTTIGTRSRSFEGVCLTLTVSAGLSELPTSADVRLLIQRADDALYTSKRSGRNRGYWHDGETILPFVPERLADELPAVAAPRGLLESLSDRTAFAAEVARRVAEWQRGGPSLAVVLLRVDGSDGFDAETTTIVLKATTQFLKAAVRQMDQVARFDAETFAILLPAASPCDAETLAERLRRAIERCELPVRGQRLRFTVSLGVAEISRPGVGSQILERALDGLNTAVHHGGNRTCHGNDRRTEEADAIVSLH